MTTVQLIIVGHVAALLSVGLAAVPIAGPRLAGAARRAPEPGIPAIRAPADGIPVSSVVR